MRASPSLSKQFSTVAFETLIHTCIQRLTDNGQVLSSQERQHCNGQPTLLWTIYTAQLFILPSFHSALLSMLYWTTHIALDNSYCPVVHTALFPFCTVVHAVLDNPYCTGQSILQSCSYCTFSILHCCQCCTGQLIMHWTTHTAFDKLHCT